MANYQPSAGDADEGAAVPGAGAQDQDTGNGGGGFCVEIHVKPDGSISVSVEPESEENSEEGGEDGGADADAGGEDTATPVKSVKEALTLALEIIRNDGQMPQRADDDFQQGFDQGATK